MTMSIRPLLVAGVLAAAAGCKKPSAPPRPPAPVTVATAERNAAPFLITANGIVELAGPELIGLDDLVRRYLTVKRDARKVVTDVHARYFGTELNDKSLTPGDNPHIGPTTYQDWLNRQAANA